MSTTLQEQYKEAALSIARSICRDAIWNGNRCNWLGASNEQIMGASKEFSKALGTQFYDGTSGIAFFLLSVCAVHQDEVITETCKGALQQLLDTEADKEKKETTQYGKLGFHTGYTGMAWVLWYAGDILGDKKYHEAAMQLIEKILAVPREHYGYDMIDGAASAIPVLLKLFKHTNDARLARFAIELGQYLSDSADKQPHGWSWNTMAEKTFNLTGYGHGAAGMGHAFAELYGLTGNPEYAHISTETARYEDYHFQQQQENWPDFRQFAEVSTTHQAQPSCSCAWCHGAPGIGLSRLRAYTLTHNPVLLQDAQRAISTTLKNNTLGALGNYSLCHGLFGNAELLLYGSEVLQQPALRAAAEKTAAECITKYIVPGLPLPNGLHSQTTTPDFMLGNTGIGYFFLRLYDSAKFPCMLLITP